MRVILDERERDLNEKCKSLKETSTLFSSIDLSKKVLDLGDILFQTDDEKDFLLIERKTFSDLLASIKDGRYEEQSFRLIHSTNYQPHSIIYLIEGNFSQLFNPVEKKTILSAITTLNIFKGFSVFRTSNVSETAEWLMNMAKKIQKELSVGKKPQYSLLNSSKEPITLENELEPTSINEVPSYCTVAKRTKKENITRENIGEILLCQIPGVSSVTAVAIMKKFSSFPNLIEELKNNAKCLDGIMCESTGKSRKISKACVKNIFLFLRGEPMVPPNPPSL